MAQHSTPGPAEPRPGLESPSELGFTEKQQPKSWKKTLQQPTTLAGIAVGLIIVGAVLWLEFIAPRTFLPPPEISYELLRNEGRTDGAPVAIKMNHLTLFVVDDPMSGGGAERAKEVVASLESLVTSLQESPGQTITLDYYTGGLPAVIQQLPDGAERRLILQLTPGDLAQASEQDAKLLSRAWAERLTDALKLYIFGEEPEFTNGTDFGNALMTMYMKALEDYGAISGAALEDAFESLTEEQKLALRTFPLNGLSGAGEDPAPNNT